MWLDAVVNILTRSMDQIRKIEKKKHNICGCVPFLLPKDSFRRLTLVYTCAVRPKVLQSRYQISIVVQHTDVKYQ